MFSRFRILPLTIFVATLLLTVKVGEIWQDVSEITRGIDVRTVVAQQTPPALPVAGDESGDETVGVAPPLPLDLAAPAVGTAAQQAALEEEEEEEEQTSFTRSELRLLQELAERRQLLVSRERIIEEREVLLRAAEQRLVEKQVELNAAKVAIEGLLDKVDEQEKARIRQLVNIYENMKPKDAARIFDELEMPVLLGVIQNMKERKVAPVIAAMAPTKARDLTRQLAARRTIPATQ